MFRKRRSGKRRTMRGLPWLECCVYVKCLPSSPDQNLFKARLARHLLSSKNKERRWMENHIQYTPETIWISSDALWLTGGTGGFMNLLNEVLPKFLFKGVILYFDGLFIYSPNLLIYSYGYQELPGTCKVCVWGAQDPISKPFASVQV